MSIVKDYADDKMTMMIMIVMTMIYAVKLMSTYMANNHQLWQFMTNTVPGGQVPSK